MAADPPFFTYERQLKPLPSGPTRCRCGRELEPLRRYAGLCRECIASGAKPAPAPTEQLRVSWTFVRFVERAGQRERHVEVRCECGAKRVLKWSIWQHHRPKSCNKCRLRGVDARGFEAEYAR